MNPQFYPMKQFLKLSMLTFIVTQTSFSQKYNDTLVTKNSEINFAKTQKRGIKKNNIMETTTQISKPKALNIVLWVGQVILAFMFLMAGFMKTTTPIVELVAQQPWAAQMPEALVRFIGTSEILGAIGLILHAALRIKPQLTVWAASGLAVVMLLATFFHASRGEFSAIIVNITLGMIAVFIAWGRNKKATISPR